MSLRFKIAIVAFAFLGLGNSWAQNGVQPVAPPVNPTAESQCIEFRDAWYQRVCELEHARDACQRRDGGTVRFSDGPWMPNCGARQQVYVTCAGITDQVCWASKQMSEQGQQCSRQVSAYLNMQRQQKNQAQRVEEQIRQSVQTIQNMYGGATELRDKGVAGTVVNRLVGTPEGGGLHGMARDAARTVNAPGADSQPMLNEAGERSDELHRALVRNPLVAEPGIQSNATSRARMGDALNQLDEALQSAPNVEMPAASVTSPIYASPSSGRMPVVPDVEPSDENEQDDEEREAAKLRLQMLETMNKELQNLNRSLRANGAAVRRN